MAELAHRQIEAKEFTEHPEIVAKFRTFFQRLAQIRDSRRKVCDPPKEPVPQQNLRWIFASGNLPWG